MLQKLLSLFHSPQIQQPKNCDIKPVMLVIMDGWGIAPPSFGNVIARTTLPHIDKYLKEFPHGELIAAGEAVGLPANEVGNTEVGHLTIGTGRVTYQGLKRINVAIENRSFLRNPAFQQVLEHVKKNNSKLHLMGILSSGNVHGSLPHFYALLEVCQRAGLHENVFVHAFTDGRDAPPQEALTLFEEIEQRMRGIEVGQFATVSGRYYAMDRDRRWERIEKVYLALTEGKGQIANSYQEAIKAAYDKKLSDELIMPTVLVKDGKPIATIDDNDGCIFFNFRIDRPRELTMALTMPDFEKMDISKFGYSDTENKINAKKLKNTRPFQRQKVVQNLAFSTMTNYHENIPVTAVAFDTVHLENPVGKVISDNGLLQLRLAESEKERFVAYYLNGHHDEAFPGEERIVVSSPKVPTYDKKPEMSVFKVVDEFKKSIALGKFHFYAMNIANPDMVAHTGNIAATIKAIQATDKAVGEIVDTILACDGSVFITADHGNAEELITYPTSSFFFTTEVGTTNTDHSNNPVPFIFVNKKYHGKGIKLGRGVLSDVAPTILAHMNLPIPKEMSGKNLLKSIDELPIEESSGPPVMRGTQVAPSNTSPAPGSTSTPGPTSATAPATTPASTATSTPSEKVPTDPSTQTASSAPTTPPPA
jgi:2,3-bisphosphoglycerate-independent phosphoglycerate mutase